MAEKNTFDFIGKIAPCKATENFKPYEENEYDSGWRSKKLKFNMVCGTNRHTLEVNSVILSDSNKATVRSVAKGGQNSEGEKTKDKTVYIPFNDRLKQDVVDSIANYAKFIIDTEIPNRRQNLEHAIDKFKSGEITDEQMEKLGVKTLEECEAALEKSKKKRHEYISEYDFIDFIKKLIEKDEIKNWMWHITGDYTLEYNSKDDRWYRKFNPQRIYRADDNTESRSQGTFYVVFNNNAIDDSDFEETNKIHINGFVRQYLGNPYKKFCFSPMVFTIDGTGNDETKKKATVYKKKFVFPDEYDREYRQIGIVCNIIDGAQVVELTEDMLSEEQRENLKYGLTTMEEIKRELGKPVYGDKVQDIVMTSLARGCSNGSKDTAYIEKDMAKPFVDNGDDGEGNAVEDIFDEDEI